MQGPTINRKSPNAVIKWLDCSNLASCTSYFMDQVTKYVLGPSDFLNLFSTHRSFDSVFGICNRTGHCNPSNVRLLRNLFPYLRIFVLWNIRPQEQNTWVQQTSSDCFELFFFRNKSEALFFFEHYDFGTDYIV